MRTTFLAVLASLLLVPCANPARAADPDIRDLIQGVLARSEAVFSGRLKSRVVCGFRGKEANVDTISTLVFAGNSWRVDQAIPMAGIAERSRQNFKEGTDLSKLTGNLEIITTSHAGKFARYKATPQLDGKMAHSVWVSTQRPLRADDLETPPVFAGTFWFSCTPKFIRDNMAKAKLLPPVEVNGVQAQVLEWAVPRDDRYRAFHAVNGLTEKGGHLRVYVAPQFGYALARIECVGEGGKVAGSFDSSEFKDRGNGVFLPRRCSLQYHDADGPGYYQEFELLKVRDVNGSISDKEFVIEVPTGTVVSDARSGTHSTWFELKDKTSIPADLTDVIAPPSFFSWKRSPAWAITVGVAAGVVLALGAFLLWRWRRSARKEAKP